MPTINLNYHPHFTERARVTYEQYELIDIVANDDERYSIKKLKPKKDRTCLFCGGKFGDVTFQSDAHLISKHIGNSSLFSDFECHSCNLRFGKMEDDLAKFLGVAKSLAKGKESKMEGFKGKFLSAHSRSFIGNDFLILAPKDIKREGNKTSIRYIKNPYTPLNVYKSLVKFSLSLLPNDVVKNTFQSALDFLSGKMVIQYGAPLSWYTLPFNNTLPLYILIFKKKDKEANLPLYMMSFYFNNFIVNLPLLFDGQIKNNITERNIITPPPYFGNDNYLSIPVHSHVVRDFASSEKLTDEWEELTFIAPEDSDKKLWAYDTITDKMEQRPYDGTGIKYMIITKEGVSVDPKAFSQFIRNAMEGKSE